MYQREEYDILSNKLVVKRMKKFFVYIDDSGSPGQNPTHKFIAPETKIWAAIILSSEEKEIVDYAIEQALAILKHEIPLTEFHSTDIYSGINDFKNVNPSKRLSLFNFFTQLYNRITPKVLVHAIGKDTLSNSGFSDSYIAKTDNDFRFNKPSDYALYLTLLDVQNYMMEELKNENGKIQVIIDEGRRVSDTTQKLSGVFTMFTEIHYKSSSNVYGLQFADFIAFLINRVQTNFVKSRSNFDREFLKIVGKLELNSNLNTLAVSDVEMLNRDYIESNYPNAEKVDAKTVQYIEELSRLVSRKPSSIDKDELLSEAKRIKQQYGSCASKEFIALLDAVEHLLPDGKL